MTKITTDKLFILNFKMSVLFRLKQKGVQLSLFVIREYIRAMEKYSATIITCLLQDSIKLN